MSFSTEQANRILKRLNEPQLKNLYAQADSKHILNELNEQPESFPSFDTDIDVKVTFASYNILSLGCSFAEQGDRDTGATEMERAASLLMNIHGHLAKESRNSGFHVFVAAMAFYAAGHYSRAFVAIRDAEEHTQAAQIIGAFLRKKSDKLIERLNEVLLIDKNDFGDQRELEEWQLHSLYHVQSQSLLNSLFQGQKDLLNSQINNFKMRKSFQQKVTILHGGGSSGCFG